MTKMAHIKITHYQDIQAYFLTNNATPYLTTRINGVVSNIF